jgi:hypothetical protein
LTFIKDRENTGKTILTAKEMLLHKVYSDSMLAFLMFAEGKDTKTISGSFVSVNQKISPK